MPHPDPDVVRVLKEYRAALDTREAGLMADMATQWLSIERKLDADIALLAREMADRAAMGKIITEQMVWKAERYQIIKSQLEEQIGKYSSGYAAQTIATAQGQYALLGIDAAQAAINVQYGPMGTYFNKINLNAVESMIGFAGDGSPLSKLLKASYPDATDGLLKALINGIARGQGPAQTARDMANGMGMGLERALLIARTESARAYRTGSLEQYRESGVVRGFKRLVKKETACLACLMLDGETFDLESELDDHPRGKCTAIPLVQGVGDPKYQTGEQWFKGLSADEQRSMMGNERYTAWKDGKFGLQDLARVTQNDVWGLSPRVATLAELAL
jgi:SPP1 gp7 family putative phage head morphogenesis protein